MNILILSWRGPSHPHAGGAELVTHQHAKAWVKAGHEVTLFTSTFKGAEEIENIDGVKIVRKGNTVLGVQFAAFFWYLLHRGDFDLVIDHFHGIPFFTPLYVHGKKLAFIHEIAGDVWALNPWPRSVPYPLNSLPKIIGPRIEPLIFRMFYKKVKFLTVSESTKEDLSKMGIDKRKIYVILNGISQDIPICNINKSKIKTVLFLGAVAKDKGIDDALRVFAELEAKDENWQYWVVGRRGEQEKKETENLMKELNILKKVRFWGFVTDKKKFELLAKSHVLVNPSVHEGWGLVNIEANAVGTPVVAYNVHGIKDSVVDIKTGFLVEKGDYHMLAYHIIRLMRNEKEYQAMQKECIKWSRNFSWEKATSESLKLIETL